MQRTFAWIVIAMVAAALMVMAYFEIGPQGGDAGQFHIDKDGYVVSQGNMRLQGYTADASGVMGSSLGGLLALYCLFTRPGGRGQGAVLRFRQ